MTQVIWKYEVPMDDQFSLELPRGARLLTVQAQREAACLWCLVDKDETAREIRKFYLAITGRVIKATNLTFIGTFQLVGGAFIGHLFEIGR